MLFKDSLHQKQPGRGRGKGTSGRLRCQSVGRSHPGTVRLFFIYFFVVCKCTTQVDDPVGAGLLVQFNAWNERLEPAKHETVPQ